MRTWTAALMVLLLAAGLQGPGAAQFQPVGGPDVTGLVERTDLAQAAPVDGAQRILRFVQVSDAHIIDDDAPPPLRVDPLDDVFEPFSDGAHRPQEEYTDEVLDAMIRTINQIHAEDALDFVINTGDNIDNELENELMRFIDNWEGTFTTTGPITGLECAPDGQSASADDGSTDSTDACTHLPESFATANTPLVAGLPWFSAFGNHDGLIQGNVPVEPSFNEIAGTAGRHFLSQEEYVRMHFLAGHQCAADVPAGRVDDDFGHGYGFAGARLCDDDPDNDGYYAFESNGVRFLVLDTVNDDFVTGNENLQGQFNPEGTIGYDVFGGYAEGSVDPAQYDWVARQIRDNPDDLIVLFSHHTINSMFLEPVSSQCGGPGCLRDVLEAAGYKTHDDMLELLTGASNVAGWIGGHTHRHRIEAKMLDGSTGPGFWNIESSSLIDMPQEARVIELWSTGDKAFWLLRNIGHDFVQSTVLAAGDPQGSDGSGSDADREVMLWLDVPDEVVLAPQPALARYTHLALAAPNATEGYHGEAQEPIEVVVEVVDGRFGHPVAGLLLSAEITHRPPGNASSLLTDVDGPMADVGGGRYAVTFTPPDAATYFARIAVEDPAGIYPDNGRVFSLRIDGDIPLPKDKGSPAPLLVVVAAVAVAAAWRRQNR